MASTSCANTTVLVLGILELILALGIIGCGIMDISNKSRFYKLYHGLWGGGYLALTAFFAIMAGAKKARGMHVAHMIMAILGLIFVLPGMSTVFLMEGINDYLYSYYDDVGSRSYCYNCFYGTNTLTNSYSNYGLNWGATTQSSWNINSNSLDNTINNFMCNDILTNKSCHPNLKALRFEKLAIIFGSGLFLLFIISASFNCCAICACCGARNPGVNPSDGVVVYPAATAYGIPANNSWSNQPISYSETSNYPATGMQQYPPAGMQQHPQAGMQHYPEMQQYPHAQQTVVFT